MGNYEQLKTAISDVIKTNGNQEITGAIMQNALLTIISTIGSNATFAGIATPTTNPGTPDAYLFYIAAEKGLYNNFGGIEVSNNVIVITNDNNNWRAIDTQIPNNVKISGIEKVLLINGVKDGSIVAENEKEINKYIASNGNVLTTVSKTELKSYIIDISKKYVVLGSVSNNNFPVVGYYDIDNKCVGVEFFENNLTIGSFQLTIPNTAKTVKVVGYISKQFPFLYEMEDDIAIYKATKNSIMVEIINKSIGNEIGNVEIKKIWFYGFFNSTSPTLNNSWFTSRLFIPIANKVNVKDKNGNDVKFRVYSFDKNQNWLRTTTSNGADIEILEDAEYIAFATTSGTSIQVTQMTEEDFLLCKVYGLIGFQELPNRVKEIENEIDVFVRQEEFDNLNASVGNINSPNKLGTPYSNGYYVQSTKEYIENENWFLSNFFVFKNNEAVTISLEGIDNLSMRIGTFDANYNLIRWISSANTKTVIKRENEVFCCFATAKDSGYKNLTLMTEQQFALVEVTNAYRTINLPQEILKIKEGLKDKLPISALETVNGHLLYPLIPNKSIYIPENGTICILGASFAVSSNGWFELACNKLSVTAMNKAIVATSICDDANKYHDGTLWTDEEFEEFDVLVLMHVHNQDVYYSTELKEDINEYVFPMRTTAVNYAPAFDYVIRKYIADCYEQRNVESSAYYNTPNGKPCQIVLCTHWNDARTIYNYSVRKLAAKWNIPLITFDENIGWSRFIPLYKDGQEGGFQTSRIHTANPEAVTGASVETIDGVIYGWHPIGGQDKYIQNKMSSIFVKQI